MKVIRSMMLTLFCTTLVSSSGSWFKILGSNRIPDGSGTPVKALTDIECAVKCNNASCCRTFTWHPTWMLCQHYEDRCNSIQESPQATITYEKIGTDDNCKNCASGVCLNGAGCDDSGCALLCTCAAGYTGLTCDTDIDECLTNNGDCEQVCTNTFGSRYCGCWSGLSLTVDGLHCYTLRIAGGGMEGRIEVYYHGQWGTVCDDEWDNADATAACRAFGYSSGIAHSEATHGEGSGPIWLDQLGCYGNEYGLDSCYHWPVGEHDCEHTEDASVTCYY